MNHASFLHMTKVLDEHAEALRLLQAVHDGEDGILPQIHTFLKKVAERKAAEQVGANVKALHREKRKTGGRKNSGAFEVSPGHEGGTDFGATGLVLARKGNLRLLWRSGHKYWANMMEGCVYSPGNLVIMTDSVGRGRPGVEYLTQNHGNAHEGDTRLNRALIEKFQARIDAVFGPGVTEQAAGLKMTIVIPAQPEAAC